MAMDDEAVGYGKPPKKSRFRPGQSGNPAGRRKGERNVATALAAELKAKVSIREDGRERKISKAEGMAKALVLKALKGDAKAFAQIMSLLPQHFRVPDLAPTKAAASDAEQAILERFITRRINERTSMQPPGTPESTDQEGNDNEH